MLTSEKLAEIIERIDADTGQRLDVLGERYSDEVVKPFCDEHGLKFLSGMGTYFFVNMASGDILYADWDEARGTPRPPYLDRMIEINADLEAEVVTRHPFGSYVPDVNNGEDPRDV